MKSDRVEKLKKAWRNRSNIVEGFSNLIFIKEEVERVASNREKICSGNYCGFYDKEGSSEKAFIKGSPACGICGCNIKALTHSLHSQCSLSEVGEEPLWEAEMTEDEENSINDL